MFSRDTTIAKANEDELFDESVQKEIDNAKSSVMQYIERWTAKIRPLNKV